MLYYLQFMELRVQYVHVQTNVTYFIWYLMMWCYVHNTCILIKDYNALIIYNIAKSAFISVNLQAELY
jgi:hypothetical protein